MSITTVDGAIAGMQYPRTFVKTATPTLVAGRPHSLFYLAGMPGAATASSDGAGGAAVTSYAGQIPFTNPTSGNTYLARLQAQMTVAGGTLILADRLWHNSGLGITTTGQQTVNSATWPARDANGSTDGVGVQIAIEVTGATGSGTPTYTMVYTNSANSGSRNGTGIIAGQSSSAIGAFYMMGLDAGDVGVRSIQTIGWSASMSSGSVSIVAYRELARLELSGANTPNAIDILTGGFPRLYDNTVPFLIIIPSTTTASVVTGQVIWTQG